MTGLLVPPVPLAVPPQTRVRPSSTPGTTCTPSGKTSLSCQFENLLPTGSSKPHARTLTRIPSRSFVMMSSHLPSHDDDGMLDAFAMDRREFAFVAELLEQRSLALFRVLNVALLDVAVAAYRFGYRGQLHRRFVVAGIEVGDQLLNQPLVFHDQAAIQLAVLAVAEDVEGSAPQALEFRHQLEGTQHPRAERALTRYAGHRVRFCQERRRHVEGERKVALERCIQLLQVVSVRIEPRHLVLVLVGEQLVVVARHRFGEFGAARDL